MVVVHHFAGLERNYVAANSMLTGLGKGHPPYQLPILETQRSTRRIDSLTTWRIDSLKYTTNRGELTDSPTSSYKDSSTALAT